MSDKYPEIDADKIAAEVPAIWPVHAQIGFIIDERDKLREALQAARLTLHTIADCNIDKDWCAECEKSVKEAIARIEDIINK